EERELQEARLFDAAARAEHFGRRALGALDQNRDAIARENAADRGFLVGRCARGDEQVKDREPRAPRVRGIEAALVEPRGPERAWDVGQDAGAIPLTIDAARAMRERPHPVDDLREDQRVRS